MRSDGLKDALYTADAGERNEVTVSHEGHFKARWVLFRDPAGVRPGPGCVRPVPMDSTLARCGPGAVDEVRVEAGDLPDRVRILGSITTRVRGGPGADVLLGGSGRDRLDGGAGSDIVAGGGGYDELGSGSAPDGSDTLRGGDGLDTASYRMRRSRVAADLHGDRDDGARGERDQIGSDVETLVGGAGADRLTGNRAAVNHLFGGAGADLLRGGAGRDVLVPGSGPDADRLEGGAGPDELFGNRGPNVLDGGPGRDELFGLGGDDVLRARDGFPDSVFCDRGRDRVSLDRVDFFAAGCESYPRRRDAAATLLEQANGLLLAGCPADGPRYCKGIVRGYQDGRLISSEPFVIGRGGRDYEGERLEERATEGKRLLIELVTRDRRGRGVVRHLRVRYQR